MSYCRHPCAAACSPPPSGCRLRRFPGLHRANRRIHSFQMVFLARRPPKSGLLIGYSSEKIDLWVGEIWPPCWLLMWVHGGIETKNNSFPSANATHLPRPKTTQNGVPPLSFTGIKCATFAQEGPGRGGGLPFKGGALPFKTFLSQFLIGFSTQNKSTLLYFPPPFRLRFL